MNQNLARRESAFHATKMLDLQHSSSLLLLSVVSVNEETVHFFPPELKKKSQQTEGWSQFEKNNSTMRWCNAYKYCPIRQGLSGLSGLVRQLKLTRLVPRAHKTKNLGIQHNPRRLNSKGTFLNLLLKIAHHIFVCFIWQMHWLGGLVCLPGLASAQHLSLMDVGRKCAKMRHWRTCESLSLVQRVMRQL